MAGGNLKLQIFLRRIFVGNVSRTAVDIIRLLNNGIMVLIRDLRY